MKIRCAFFISFLLLLFASEIDARRGPALDYWKAVMRDQPMPDFINSIIDQEMTDPSEEKGFWSRFNKDFDVTPNAIIYHPRPQIPSSSTTARSSKLDDQDQLRRQMIRV